jgi:low affinity Fe/Cu permease
MTGFRRFAEATGRVAGFPWTSRPPSRSHQSGSCSARYSDFSDTWQLTMNIVASQVTFPIAFLLQNTQNRDTRALQLKLDELIRSDAAARKQLINLDAMDDAQLDALKQEFERVRERRSRAGVQM